MNEIVRTDILNVINNSLIFIEKEDFVSLKDLSNHVIHNASIFQDKYSINIAVIIYCISKIFKRQKKIDPKLKNDLIKLKSLLEQDDMKKYDALIKQVYKKISKEESQLKFYISKVLELAQIKKGTKIYDHGISLSQSAQILGISVWDLMDYIGKTHLEDNFDDKNNIENKLRFTRSLFGLR